MEMEDKRPSQTTAKEKTEDRLRSNTRQTVSNGDTAHYTKAFKVAPVIVKGLTNTSRRALDGVLREKLPGLKIDNIIFNQRTKIYTIQPTDIQSHQQLLDNFPKESFPNDKNPTLFVPTNIKQVIETESVCFMKDVDLDYDEEELKHALQNEGIHIKQLFRLTRPIEGTTVRRPMTTVKVICKDKKNRDTLLRTGLRISLCIFRCEPAKPNDIPLQCKKCNQFGHIIKYCKAEKEVCTRCGEQHPTSECHSTTINCSNCKNNHESTSKQCPVFIQRQEKLRRTINEYTTPIQPLPSITSEIEYPHMPSRTQKQCRCTQDLFYTKFDAIVDQMKTTNELVHNLMTTVAQLAQMQQGILTILANQQQNTTTAAPYPFQEPPPMPLFRFPPPPPSNYSPNQNKRPAKQQKCEKTPQQQNNDKSTECPSKGRKTPIRKNRQTNTKQNSSLSLIVTESPADNFRTQTMITSTPEASMELEQQQ